MDDFAYIKVAVMDGPFLKMCLLHTAIGLIRAVTTVEYLVTSLGPVVASPISTSQLCTFRVI